MGMGRYWKKMRGGMFFIREMEYLYERLNTLQEKVRRLARKGAAGDTLSVDDVYLINKVLDELMQVLAKLGRRF